jgi:hypothetical protein
VVGCIPAVSGFSIGSLEYFCWRLLWLQLTRAEDKSASGFSRRLQQFFLFQSGMIVLVADSSQPVLSGVRVAPESGRHFEKDVKE